MKFFGHYKGLALATIFLFAFFSVFLQSGTVSAQSVSDVFVELTPELPGPHQNVSVRLTSYSGDLDRASISWSLNGKTILSGVGKKVFSFTTGASGSSSRILLTVTGADGTVEKSLTIQPGEVDMLWQTTDSYTPPFYRGKALPSPEGTIKIVAMPTIQSGGTAIKANSLVYKWSRNNKVSADSSGYGKNSIVFRNNYLDLSENITAEVSSLDSSAGAKGKILINIGQPFVLFYENSSLGGIIYENALPGNLNMSNQEIKITAEPYFISAFDKLGGDMKYEWQLNDDTVNSSPGDGSSIILRNEGGSGSARISLAVSNIKRILQTAGNSFLVNFGNR